MKNLIISRKTWLRGDDINSFLLREEDGKMCCLGSLALSCGINKVSIKNKRLPHNLSIRASKKLPKDLYRSNLVDSLNTERITKINDSPKISDKVREAKLKLAFKKIGYKVKFVD